MTIATFETDVIPTSVGDLTITFIGHGSLMMTFKGKTIHIDPFSGNTSSGFVLAPGGGWSPIGRDLIAYIYIRDMKGW